MRILISGGGTGGHIFPALAIANALKRRHPQAEILFVGADNRMEMQRVPEAGYKIIGLPVAGFDRKKIWRNFKVLWKLWKSMRMARQIVRDFNPDIAIGVGGYASGPMLKAAQKRGIPTVLQEQNSYPGVTNKLLAKKADAICVAYEGTERFFPANKIVLSGNPVRKDLTMCSLSETAAKKALGFDPVKPLILVVGGSLGARTVNQSVEAGIEAFDKADVQVLWQTGKLYADHCLEVAKGHQQIQAMPFIQDMAIAYRAADLVVARAGACTISELEILGKPALLVPSPNVAEDHQRKNAQALVDKGAAVMILDADAPRQMASKAIEMVHDKKTLKSLSANIQDLALHNADEAIADKIDQILNK